MKVLRTPDERFENLADYPFAPNYVEVAGMRMHYVDEGGGNSDEVMLMLHGEPSWSYLYRKMIPLVVASGARVVAPDLIGFGKSDKPAERSAYTYQNHVDWMAAFVSQLDLQGVTLFAQDWGGLIGLRVAMQTPQRFRRILAANTFLPTGDRPASEAFLKWQVYSQHTEHFHVGGIVKGGCVSELPEEVIAAYDAPFPDDSYIAGARQFPVIVPTAPDDPQAQANRRAWEALKSWRKPFLTAFSDSDPIMRGGDLVFQKVVPGAAGQKHTTITGAGHFLQEDKGEELAEVLIEFIAEN